MNCVSAMNEWQNNFGGTLPVTFSCIESLRDRWLRVHSLSDKEWYTENDRGLRLTLKRQQEFSNYVLGEGSDCVLFIASLEGASWKKCNAPLGDIIPKHVMSHAEGDDQRHFFAANIIWHLEDFADLMTAVANDECLPVVIANMVRRTAYLPYDSGADLIFRSAADASTARRDLSEWVSDREDGL